MNRQKILIVDDEEYIVKALVRTLDSIECNIDTTLNPEEAINKIYSNRYDIILTDQRMPNITGIQLIKEAQKIDSNILGILLTGYSDIETAISAINEVNIYRYISKPWDNDEIVEVISQSLKYIKAKREKEEYDKLIFENMEKYKEIIKTFAYKINSLKLQSLKSLLRVLQAKDMDLFKHSVRVSNYSILIAKKMGLLPHQIRHLRLASLLHDIGKIAIKDQILDKPDKLSSDEFVKIKEHPIVGYKILKELEGMERVALIVCQHHEKVDGTGYPFGINGNVLLTESKILAVADSFDAITSERVYRGAMTKKEAIKTLLENAGTHYDPQVIKAFMGGIYE